MRRSLSAVLAIVLIVLMGTKSMAAEPVLDAEGTLRFSYGDRSIPVVQCYPLYVTDIVLEAGETILNVAVGDSIRWILSPASSGKSGETPHILVKPTDVGLQTNLVITTSKRSYYMILTSKPGGRYNPRIGFFYPGETQQPTSFNGSGGAAVAGLSGPPADLPLLSIKDLDFNYHIDPQAIGKGRHQRLPRFVPVRAFNDGVHTYIEMERRVPDMPVLVIVSGNGSFDLANYRFKGNDYVLDGVPDKLALIIGSGNQDQERVFITHTSV